jgi:hypothetical protein
VPLPRSFHRARAAVIFFNEDYPYWQSSPEVRLFNSIKNWLADRARYFLGAWDFYTHPKNLDAMGGPFNGQSFRQAIFLDLVRACNFRAIVETGAFRGSTTLFLAQNSGGAPVFTCEINKRIYEFARRSLRAIPSLHIVNSDSRKFLSALNLSGAGPVFFYLDAHWLPDLPLAEELELIARNFPSFVIMIDDFQVPDDPGYSYDDYGPGKCLSLRNFRLDSDARFAAYFPARHSSGESGRRRGCIVLASPDVKDKVDSLDSLLPTRAS